MLNRLAPIISSNIEKFSLMGSLLIKMCFMGPVETSRIDWNANSLETGSDVTIKCYPLI